MAKLCAPLDLPTASPYQDAPEPGLILPVVFGDFSEGGLRGPIPAVLIDNVNWVYAAAGHAVGSISQVYVDDLPADPAPSVSVSNNYQGHGVIATITFAAQPTGVVTWRGTGYQESGTLTNPIRQLQILLETYGDYATSDFEATALADSKLAVSGLGYETAWVVNDRRTVQDWVTEWMFNVMGYWRVTGLSKLELLIDSGSIPETLVVERILAARDCEDGDDGIEMTFDRRHLINKLSAYYLWSTSVGQASSRVVTLERAVSVNAMGEVRKAVTLKGVRTAAYLTTWSNILFDRQAFVTRVEGATVAFTVVGPKLFHATVGDLVAFTWPFGPTREQGNPYSNEILRIVSISHDLKAGGKSSVVALDTGRYLSVQETELDAEEDYDADLFFGGGRLI